MIEHNDHGLRHHLLSRCRMARAVGHKPATDPTAKARRLSNGMSHSRKQATINGSLDDSTKSPRFRRDLVGNPGICPVG